MSLSSHFWNKKICAKIAHSMVKWPVLYVFGVLLITGASLFLSSKLSIDSNYMAFLPESFPGVQNLKEVIKRTGGGFGNFMVVIEGSTPEVRRNYAKNFTEEAAKFDWVDYAEYQKGWEKISQNRLLYLGVNDLQLIYDRLLRFIDAKKVSSSELYIDFLKEDEQQANSLSFDDIKRKYQATSFGTPYFEDPDLKYTIVVVWPKGSMTDMGFSKKVYQDLQDLKGRLNPDKDSVGLQVSIGGEFRSKIDEYDSLMNNVLGSSTLSFLGIGFLLILFYRKVGSVFYTLIPLVIGSLWCFGLAYLFVGRLNLLTVFLVAILFGIGVDYGIYLFSRYVEERRHHPNIQEAIALVLEETGRGLISASLTTALAFGILVFTDFKGFREFGLLAFAGIASLLFAYLGLSPVIWVLAERWKLIHPKKVLPMGFKIPVFKSHRAVLFFNGVLFLACLLALPFVKFEYDYGNLRSVNNSYWKLKSKIQAVFPLSKTPAIVVTDTLEETREVVQAVRDLIPQVTTVDTVKSILDFLPEDTLGKKTILQKIEALLDKNQQFFSLKEKEQVEQFKPYLHPTEVSLSDIPKSILRQFTFPHGAAGYSVLIYDKVPLSNAKKALQYANDIRDIKTASGKVFHPSEGSMLFADALTLMKKEALFAFLAMVLVVFTVLFLEFRKLKFALIVFTPIIFSFFLTFGLMVLFNIKLNIFNLVIFPILIGMADDSCIHLYHRLTHNEKNTPIPTIINQTGNSVLLATLTAMIGFGSIMSSDHQGLKSLGLLALVGMAANLYSSLVFFPSFLKWQSERKV